METPYKEAFPAGSRVRIVSRPALDAFAQSWKFHHRLQPEQMACAGTTSTVSKVGFYHGGGSLYVLENLPGIWHEPCLEPAP